MVNISRVSGEAHSKLCVSHGESTLYFFRDSASAVMFSPVHEGKELVVVDEEVLLCEDSLDVITGQVSSLPGIVLTERCVEVAVTVADLVSGVESKGERGINGSYSQER